MIDSVIKRKSVVGHAKWFRPKIRVADGGGDEQYKRRVTAWLYSGNTNILLGGVFVRFVDLQCGC